MKARLKTLKTLEKLTQFKIDQLALRIHTHQADLANHERTQHDLIQKLHEETHYNATQNSTVTDWAHATFRQYTLSRCQELRAAIEELAEKIDLCREEMKELFGEKKAFSIMIERHVEQQLQDEAKQTQTFLDDVAARQYMMRLNESNAASAPSGN